VDVFLQKCQSTVDAWESDLEQDRDGLADVKAKILAWLTVAAIAATVLFSSVVAGQPVCTRMQW
jgi:hypothetical protein